MGRGISCTTHQFREKRLSGAFFVSAAQVVQVRLNRPSPPFPNLNTPGTQAMIALADNDNVYLQGENHVLNIWHFKQCR
jgi:hypothetical protein